jgi:hypothetical protein
MPGRVFSIQSKDVLVDGSYATAHTALPLSMVVALLEKGMMDGVGKKLISLIIPSPAIDREMGQPALTGHAFGEPSSPGGSNKSQVPAPRNQNRPPDISLITHTPIKRRSHDSPLDRSFGVTESKIKGVGPGSE